MNMFKAFPGFLRITNFLKNITFNFNFMHTLIWSEFHFLKLSNNVMEFVFSLPLEDWSVIEL